MLILLAIGLYFYSFLRYRYLWSRRNLSMIVYYVFQALLLGTLFIYAFFSSHIENDYVLLALQLYCCIYGSVMLVTPIFSLLRGAVRMLGKRLHWQNKIYRFFNHPTKISRIVFIITLVLGIGIFGQSKILFVSEQSVTIKKEAEIDKINIVTVSDLKIGQDMTRYEISKLFDKCEQLHPDFVVFNGNFYSHRVSESLRQFTNQRLETITKKIPVYLIEGPEEEKTSDKIIEELSQLGVRVLKDSYIQLAEGIQLVGCRSLETKSLSFLDKNKPTIVFSYDNLQEEKSIVDYDVLLHASANRLQRIMPKHIQVTTVQFESL